MKLLHKIRAFFSFKSKIQELYLSSVEIKKDKVFLHPADDPSHTVCVNSKAVEIFINPEDEVLEENIEIIDTPKNKLDDHQKSPRILCQTI